MARLNTFVAVTGPDHATAWFGPGDELPDWAIAAIGNPNVWADPPTTPPPASADPLTEPPKEVADAAVSQPRRRGRPPRAAADA